MSNLFAEELRRAANGWGRDMGQAQLLNSAAREIDRLEGLADLVERDYRELDEHHLALAVGQMNWKRTDDGYVVGFDEFEPVLKAWAEFDRVRKATDRTKGVS